MSVPPTAEIFRSVYGAWRLACLDPQAMQLFNRTPEGFWRSFFAAVLVAPLHSALLSLGYSKINTDVDGSRFVAAEAIAYVMSWVAFPLLMAMVARALDRAPHYIGYVVAYNWAMVLQHLVYVPLLLLSASAVLPADVSTFLILIVFVLVLGYVWFIARVALDITGWSAAGIVVLDLLLTFVISGAAESLY